MAEMMTYTLGLVTRHYIGKEPKTTFTPERTFTSDVVTVEDAKQGIQDEKLLDQIYIIINERNGNRPVWHDEMWRVRDGTITEANERESF